MTKEIRTFITFLHPGVMFPEETTERITYVVNPNTIPSDCYGFYFHQTEYVVDGKNEYVGGITKIGPTYIVGQSIHVDNILDIDPITHRDNDILKLNIRNNSPTKTGIRTHLGNWQAKTKDIEVLPLSQFKLGKPKIYR